MSFTDKEREVFQVISTRLKKGAGDFTIGMRIDLFTMDLILEVASSVANYNEPEVMAKVKASDGFRTLDTNVHVPDSTLGLLVREVAVSLAL